MLRWFRLIIFVHIYSTLIHFTNDEVERLYLISVKAHEKGDWGEFNKLTPTQKYAVWLQHLWGWAYG